MSNNERFNAMLNRCQHPWAVYADLQALGSHGIKRIIENTAPGIHSTGGGKGRTDFETAFSVSDDIT